MNSREKLVVSREYLNGVERDPLSRGEKYSAKGKAGLHKRGVCTRLEALSSNEHTPAFRSFSAGEPKSPLPEALGTGEGGAFNPLLIAVFTAIITFFSFTQTIHGQTTQPIDRPEELRVLDSYFQTAVEQNPELESLRYEIDAQRQRSPQVRALSDPEISAGFFLNPVTETSFAGRFSVSVMQMFPWFGTLDTRGKVEESISEAMFYSLSARQVDIFHEIQRLWFTYYKLNHHVHVNMEILRIVRDLENLVETRYETGQAGQADLLRLQMEEQRLLNTIENLEDEKNPVRERFNSFLNRDPSEEIIVPVRLPSRTLSWSKEELLEFARHHHPEFNRLDAQRSQFKNRLELARLEGRPSIGIGLEYMGRDFSMLSMMPEMNETFIAMATIRIPLYRNKYRAQRQEARFQLEAANEMETDLTNRFRTGIENAMKFLRDGQRKYSLIENELLPRSEQVLQILSEEYRTGQVRFDELLQVVRELLTLENEIVEALAKQNEAMAGIEQLIANELISNE